MNSKILIEVKFYLALNVNKKSLFDNYKEAKISDSMMILCPSITFYLILG